MSRRTRAGLRPRLIALSVAACFGAAPLSSLSLPSGPQVVAGSASFAWDGNQLTVTNSAGSILHWQSFSIGANEITRFLQPSALSAVLNRVVGSGGVVPQSLIDGVLSSNGRVFLLNPSGVVIGAGARIDVAGFVASSLHLSNEDFLAGRLRFTEVPGAGAVSNAGLIETAAGGQVYLIAPEVQNSGIIRSPQGEIVLAAGREVELVSAGNPYVSVRIVADANEALNLGSLLAESGRIGMYGALVRHAGVAEANGATVDAGGTIRFVAMRDLAVEGGSRISANGTSGGSVLVQAEGGTNLVAGTVEATGSEGAGGTVQALGLRVGVVGNAVIDASGETGGGTVLVGGDFQGRNPEVQNAERTLVGPDAVIRADARTAGDGGRVIVWADGDTRFYGNISARGGERSGDGGFVEVSGKRHLTFRGWVDTRAPMGRTGTLLLDPDDIVILPGSGDGDDGDTSSGSFSGGLPSGTSVIYESELEGTAQSTAVTVSASDSIVIENLNSTTYGSCSSSSLCDGILHLEKGGSFITAPSGSIEMKNGSNTIRTNGASLLFNSGSVTLGHLDTSGNATATGTDTSIAIYAGGNVSTGAITTGAASNTSGSADSSVSIVIFYSSGDITTGQITTGAASGTSGDADSSVSISAHFGDITTGAITTGAASNTSGQALSSVSIFADSGGITTGPITLGHAFANLSFRSVGVSALGDISTGAIYTRSTDPRNGGGGVVLTSSGGRVTVNGTIDSRGADGDYSYPLGTSGGSVSIGAQTGVQVNGAILTSGGRGADVIGGAGGHGGGVCISGGPYSCSGATGFIQVAGPIVTTGGRGGDGYVGGGSGADGGDVVLLATGSVTLGSTPEAGAFPTVIDTSGGDGGWGSVAGGSGGNAGNVHIDPASITINGVIVARGGAGGNGNVSGGDGGHGGVLDLSISSEGTITFVNGGWDLSGGAGGAPGGNPGTDGSLPFLEQGLLPALYIPSSAAQYATSSGGTLVFQVLGAEESLPLESLVEATERSTTFRFEPEAEEPQEEDEEKKRARIASCRPGR